MRKRAQVVIGKRMQDVPKRVRPREVRVRRDIMRRSFG